MTQQTAWVFPGQGSQSVGMGKAIATEGSVAASTFAAADDALGFNLSSTIFEGPAESLQDTPNQQPAIVATSIAALRELQKRDALPAPDFVAGHSLGEYSALVAAGALEFADAISLVRRRGELMQEHGAGAMAALIGMEANDVTALANDAGVEIANINAPGQITVSGRSDAVEQAMTLAKERGARRAVLLPVSAAFHSSLMAPVVEGLKDMIDATAMYSAAIPLVGNVDGQPISHPDDLRRELLDQICASVQWVSVVQTMASANVRTYYEIGPGKVLSGLITRIANDATTVTSDALLA